MSLDTNFILTIIPEPSAEDSEDRKVLNEVFLTLWRLGVIEQEDGDQLFSTCVSLELIKASLAASYANQKWYSIPVIDTRELYDVSKPV